MTNHAKMNRRVDISADISDIVYKYEENYCKSLLGGMSDDDAKAYADKELNRILPSGTTFVDANYDSDTGIAAIAVYDEQTKETYIAYAGTNWEADNWKDIISDMAIGTNNSLYLKKLGDTAVAFYDRVPILR